MGYNTYNDILTQTRTFSADDRESDFYNVTVNFVVKRIPKYALADMKKSYEVSGDQSGLIEAAEKLREQRSMSTKERPDDDQTTMLNEQI